MRMWCSGAVKRVALRKESVDRNSRCTKDSSILIRSLSARRAWIEIKLQRSIDITSQVALRKESVDRNAHRGLRLAYRRPSLSARRAWIEIK